MEKIYRVLLLALAFLLLTLIVLDMYYAFGYTRPGSLPGVPESRVGRLTGVLAILLICFLLTVSLLVVRKRVDYRNRINQSVIRLYKLVFDGLSTGVLVLDRYAKVRYINNAFCNFIGCNEQDHPLLAHYSRLVDPMLLPVSEKLAQALESGESFSREYRVFLPSGVRCFKCGYYSAQDDQLGRISIISLEDRTREDAIKQKLSRQLEETHRHAAARDNFFANMSHEIRTPINAVLGMAYFAKKLSENEKCREYIQKIENASELLLGVVNDILDFSRMQESKFSLNPETFNVYDLRKILLDLFTLKAEQKGLEFQVEFNCSDPLQVYGDQFRLTQIFMNLVGNAIKFTDQGLVAVSLNYEKIGADIILRCSVRDTGCGLSEDEVGKLFTDFEQFGQVLVKSQEGTGLGLAICKRLVELMKGVIWVDSSPGKGSVFHFVVLLQDPAGTGRHDGKEPPRIKNRHGQVLLADPAEINNEIAVALLNTLGYTGITATSMENALDLCQSGASGYYDAIAVDINLARNAGEPALVRIRDLVGEECPILGIVEPDHEETDDDYVFDGFLHRPYSPEEFREYFPDFTI